MSGLLFVQWRDAAGLKVLKQSCHFFYIHVPATAESVSQLSHSESTNAQRQPALVLPVGRLGKGRARKHGAVSGFVRSSETRPASPSLSLRWFHLLEADLCRPGRHPPCLRPSWASPESVDGLGLLEQRWKSRQSINCADKCVARLWEERCAFTQTLSQRRPEEHVEDLAGGDVANPLRACCYLNN